jgi:hypothetical protein
LHDDSALQAWFDHPTRRRRQGWPEPIRLHSSDREIK